MNGINIINSFKQNGIAKLKEGALQQVDSLGLSQLMRTLRSYIAYANDHLPAQTDVALLMQELLDPMTDAWSGVDILSLAKNDVADINDELMSKTRSYIDMYGSNRCTSNLFTEYSAQSYSPKLLQLGCSNGTYLLLGYAHSVGKDGFLVYKDIIEYYVCKASTTSVEDAILSQGVLAYRDPLDRYKLAGCPWRDQIGNFSLFDVCRDNIANQAITEEMNAVCDLATKNRLSLEWLQSRRDAFSDMFADVRMLYQQVINGWVSGGVKGAVMALIRWFQAGASFGKDEDGYFVFTKNADLTPKVYLVNILQVVFGVASVVISAVSAIFMPILSGILGGIGSLLWSAFGSFNYDLSATKASMQTDEFNSPLLWSPTRTIGFDNVLASTNSSIGARLSASGIVAVSIPFGHILIGRAGPDQTIGGVVYVPCRCEIHSSIQGRDVRIVENFMRQMYTLTNVHRLDVSNDLPTWQDALDMIIDCCEQDVEAPLYNQADGFLSDADDSKLRLNVAVNTALCCLYCYIVTMSGYTTLDYVVECPDHFNGRAGATQYDWRYPEDGLTNEPLLDYSWFLLIKVAFNEALEWADLITYTPERNVSGGAWTRFITAIVNDDTAFSGYLNLRISQCIDIKDGDQFSFFMPAYQRSSFFAVIGITLAITVAVGVVVGIASVNIKKALTKARANSAAKVEAAWDNLKQHPSPEAAEAYRKTVKKANLKAMFIGGSQFSTDYYWGGDPSSPSGEGATSVSSLLGSALSTTSTQDESLQSFIYKLITGETMPASD